MVLLPVEPRLARGKPRPRAGAEEPGGAAAARAGAHRFEEPGGRGRIEERIDEEGLRPVAPAQHRDHPLRGGGLLALLDGERQHVALRLAVAELHLEDGKAQRIEGDHVEDAGLGDLPSERSEPAPPLEERGHHHLDGRPLLRREGAFPGRGDLQRGRLVLRLARIQLGVGRLLEAEPVEGVLGQRQEIRPFADGRKARPAHQLGGDAPVELAQIQLHVVREAREVRDHQHGLVLELPDEGQYLGILRLEELDGAAPERLVALAQGDQPLHPPQQ